LWAWIETVYNLRVHSSTGEPPGKRFTDGLPPSLPRVKDISYFEALFLLRNTRTVTKYGKIKLFANQYPVKNIAHGTVVEVRYNPFDLSKIYIYQDKKLIQTIESSKITTYTAPGIPEESKREANTISEESRNYFTRLREEYKRSLIENGEYIPYSKLKTNEEENNHA
jgi:putative transposase